MSNMQAEFFTGVWIAAWFVAIWYPDVCIRFFLTGLFALILAILSYPGDKIKL